MKNLIKQIIRVGAYPFLLLYFKIRPLRLQVQGLEETLSSLQAGRKSLVRFGDGEIKLISGNRICFQDYNPDLANRLTEIMRIRDGNFLVALPDIFNGLSQLVFSARVFWVFHLFLNQKLYRHLPEKIWVNTFFSRPYIDYKRKDKALYFHSLRTLWANRNVVFIEGETTRNGVGNDLYSNAKSVTRIICPSSNAYAKFHEIIDFVHNTIAKDDLILVSLGPAAKVIVYELFRCGFQAWDIGHIDSEYEWFLSGAKKKIRIHGKHTAEINDNDATTCNDSAYLSQIVKHIT